MKKTLFIILTAAIANVAAITAGVSHHSMARTADDETTDTAKTVEKKDAETVVPQKTVADEVIWVVGDEAILLSDVEQLRAQYEAEGMTLPGNPDCRLPEQIAVQKLFLHQAALDSIEVTEAEISQGVEQQINYWISMIGSKEKLEEYRKMPLTKIRQSLHDDYKNSQLAQRMREKLVEDIKVTPSEVRQYFRNMPEDSIPYVPTEVEVEIIERAPRIKPEEVNRVKDQLRNFTERVTNGETTFATLARLYSDDPGTARNGGELDYVGRGMLDPAFAAVAFNLTDPKKISKIVESEFGYHIIQLVDKRGDKVKVRHILIKPKVAQDEIDLSLAQLDSIADDIRSGKFSFEEGATFISDDKDTRNNHGLMSNLTEDGMTSRFQMKDLPTEVARVVDTLKVGEISAPFTLTKNNGKTSCAIIKLKSRIDGHRATITEDFQVMRNVVLRKQRQKVVHDWVTEKIKHTYVRMNERYRNCQYEYEGWVK